MVPKDKVTRLRMKLAEGGLPKGGGRRLRGVRQVGRARHHLLRPEHQSPPRAGRRARPHHPRHRPHPGRPRPPRAARAPAVRARGAGAVGLDRGPGPRLAGSPADPRHPPPRRLRRQRAEAAAGLDRRRGRPAARRRRRRPIRSRRLGDERRTAFEKRMRKQVEDIVSSVVGAGPRPRPALRRFRLQQDHPDLGQVRSRGPRAALEPDPRRAEHDRRQQRPGHRQQRAARQPAEQRRRGQGPEQEDRRDQQLRDLPHHQDRGDRGRPGQPHLGRGPGRRHLLQEREGRARLSGPHQGAARPHRHPGALGDRLRPEARRPGRGRQPALRRRALHRPDRRALAASSACSSSPRTTSCTSSSSA